MYGEILQDLREGLAVSAEHDARLSRGIVNAARSLLRTYNFREALRIATAPIAANAQAVVLPADAGKIVAVLLKVVENGQTLFKRLRRRESATLPYHGGPNFYIVTGSAINLDQPMPTDAIGYISEVWYQTTDPVQAETWLSTIYSDVLEHRAGKELALKMRKQEAFQIYNALWEEDVAVLGRFIPELEFNDLDLSMGDIHRGVALERYPAS